MCMADWSVKEERFVCAADCCITETGEVFVCGRLLYW